MIEDDGSSLALAVPRNTASEALVNFDILPCVPRAHQGKLGMPMASMKPGYKMSSYNSRSRDSGCLHIDNGNIPEYERQSRKARDAKENDCSHHSFWLGQPVNVKSCRVGGDCRREGKLSRN